MTPLIFAAFSLAAAQAQDAGSCSATALEGPCAVERADLTLADLQAVGTHNSYKIAIPAPELAMIAAMNPEAAAGLDYAHAPLAEQLNMGMRQLELDLFYDPDGGRYADPILPRATIGAEGARAFDSAPLQAPGFKTFHTQDIDVWSHCPQFITCLEAVEAWSDANPEHAPILILLNLKTGSIPVPGSTSALDFTPEAFAAMEAEIRSVVATEEMITPDDVRGESATLREAVLAGGWPALQAARGKLVFALDTGAANVTTYLQGAPSLEGRVAFVNSLSEDAEHAAYFTLNDPIGQGARIRAAVEAGFLVRTRADADTVEARTNDTAKREAAFASGAQYISTDYPTPRLDWSDFAVRLPGDAPARCNPVRRGAECAPATETVQ
ncbi:MAG: phosphatidylinositol-specific phospholipase C1-like protein [Oceanicaulis sp.]